MSEWMNEGMTEWMNLASIVRKRSRQEQEDQIQGPDLKRKFLGKKSQPEWGVWEDQEERRASSVF